MQRRVASRLTIWRFPYIVTRYTMAPQVLQGIYSSQADLWSVGVIAYTLLSSTKPFYHKSKRCMVDMIMRGKLYFDETVWKPISDDAKDFVSKLIVVDPKVRLDGPKALLHSWIVNREQVPNELPSEELRALAGSLINFKYTSQLKKLALTVIAHRSTAKEILQLRKVFDSFDTVKNGYLSYDEFKEALERLNYGPEQMDVIFSSVVSLCVCLGYYSSTSKINSTRCFVWTGPRPRQQDHVHRVFGRHD
jgi:calcium-dependent protein kinase